MRSGDIRARYTTPDVPNMAWRDAVILCDMRAGARVGSDSANVVFREPSAGQVAGGMTEPVNICNVFLLRSPAKMLRVHASPVAAVSVKGEVVGRVRPLSPIQRQRDVRGVEGAICDSERAVVPGLYDSAGPNPAPPMDFAFIDLRPVIGGVDLGGIHFLHSMKMPYNPTSPQGAYHA